MLKAPSVLETLKNGLMIKLWLFSKLMTSHTGQEIIAIHILPNTSRSKDNQAIKFGQLIKYSAMNIFFQKSC